jgi:hypothetical protein
MVQIAEQIHTKVQSGQASDAELDALISEVNAINQELTPLSNGFSISIGEASLKAQRLIAMAMWAITAFLMVLGIAFTRRIIVRNVASAIALKIPKNAGNMHWRAQAMGCGTGILKPIHCSFHNSGMTH